VLCTARIFAGLVTVVILLANIVVAEAACVHELPAKRSEHWSYRLSNGEKCWFPDSARGYSARGSAQALAKAERRSPPKIVHRAARNRIIPPGAPPETAEVQTELQSASSVALRAPPEQVLDQPAPATAATQVRRRNTAQFTDVWNDRVTTGSGAGPVAVAPLTFARPVPGETVSTRSPDQPVRFVDQDIGQDIASSHSVFEAKRSIFESPWWFLLGIGLIAASLAGSGVSEMMRRRWTLIQIKFFKTLYLFSRTEQAQRLVPPKVLQWARRAGIRPAR